MKVLHICYAYGLNNTGGAAIAASRLHLTLLKAGVESHFACIDQREDGLNVHQLPSTWIERKIHYLLVRIVWLLGYLTPERQIIMPNLIPLLSLSRLITRLKPDLIHIHWIMLDTISFRQISTFNRPLVATLHDLFLINIYDPYPGKDRRFITGVNSSNSNNTERWIFQRKLQSIRNARPIFIGPSEWVCAMGRESIIGSGLRFKTIHNLITDHFSFNPQLYHPHQEIRLLFGANKGRFNPLKGWDDFLSALKQLSATYRSKIIVEVFGECAESYSYEGIPIRFLGTIADPNELQKAYHSADIFVFPSREETQGMTRIEALMCGLPVIAFNRTACADDLVHKGNGWISEDGDFPSFARGIEYWADKSRQDNYLQIRKEIAETAKYEFSTEAIIKQTINLYQEQIKNYNP